MDPTVVQWIVNGTVYEPLNPLTPLAFLPPDVARTTSIGIHIHIGCISILLWDILQNIRNDYKLLTEHRIGLPTVAYFISRIFALAFALGRAFIITLPISNCQKWEPILFTFFALTLIFTNLLFYIRVCAVYSHRFSVVVSFGFLWLAIIGASCTIPFAITATHIGPTNYCLEVVSKNWALAAPFTVLINDTCIFIATWWRLYQLFKEEDATVSNRLKSVLTSASLPAFTRAFLQDNQLYYLIVPVTKAILLIALIVLWHTPEAPLIALLVATHVIMVNLIGCQVFRNTKLGLVPDPDPTSFHISTASKSRLSPVHFRRRGLASGGSASGGAILEEQVFGEKTPLESAEKLSSSKRPTLCGGSGPREFQISTRASSGGTATSASHGTECEH